MKCVKCDFECCNSNENGTEYYCAVFGDNVPEELETNVGCNLKYNEAEKLYELNDKCIAKYYESMYMESVLYNGNPTKEQQVEIDKVNKEYSCAAKELNNYLKTVINRRKRNE